MKYTKEDKTCPHCGGNIEPNCCGDKIIYWCNICGSNDKDTPPNINIEIQTNEKRFRKIF